METKVVRLNVSVVSGLKVGGPEFWQIRNVANQNLVYGNSNRQMRNFRHSVRWKVNAEWKIHPQGRVDASRPCQWHVGIDFINTRPWPLTSVEETSDTVSSSVHWLHMEPRLNQYTKCLLKLQERWVLILTLLGGKPYYCHQKSLRGEQFQSTLTRPYARHWVVPVEFFKLCQIHIKQSQNTE